MSSGNRNNTTWKLRSYLGGERNRATVRARLTLERVAEALSIPFVLSVTKSWYHCAQAWVIRTHWIRGHEQHSEMPVHDRLAVTFPFEPLLSRDSQLCFQEWRTEEVTRGNFRLLQTGLFLKIFTYTLPLLGKYLHVLKFKCSAGTWPLCGRGSSTGTLYLLTEAKHKKALMV